MNVLAWVQFACVLWKFLRVEILSHWQLLQNLISNLKVPTPSENLFYSYLRNVQLSQFETNGQYVF